MQNTRIATVGLPPIVHAGLSALLTGTGLSAPVALTAEPGTEAAAEPGVTIVAIGLETGTCARHVCAADTTTRRIGVHLGPSASPCACHFDAVVCSTSTSDQLLAAVLTACEPLQPALRQPPGARATRTSAGEPTDDEHVSAGPTENDIDKRAGAVALTARELQVLQAIAAGHTSSVIGETLGISSHTVEGHKRRIFRRLGARNQAQAVALGLHMGLLANGHTGNDNAAHHGPDT